MSGEEFAVLPTIMHATVSAATSDGHEIEANPSINLKEKVDASVNLHDVTIDDHRKKRPLSVASDGSDDDNVVKKRRGRPAKSSSYHARKTRTRRQKDGEKKKIDVDVSADAAGGSSFMIEVGVQTEVCDFPTMSVRYASPSVLSMTTATTAIAESLSKTIKEAIEPVVKETGFITIDIKELLVALHQLTSQVQSLSATILSLSSKTSSKAETMSSSSSDSTDSDVNDDHQDEADFIPASTASSRRRRRRAERKTTGVASIAMSQSQPKPANLGCDAVASMYVDIDLKHRRAKKHCGQWHSLQQR